MTERLGLIHNLPPILQAYTRAYHGVELLKGPIAAMKYDRGRISFPWTGPVRDMVLADHQRLTSIVFAVPEQHQQHLAFTNDLASLGAAILSLHRYCQRPEYDVLNYAPQPHAVNKAGERSQAHEDYEAAFDQALTDFCERFAPIRQTLVCCRYSAREMYPDHFGTPIFERRPEFGDEVGAQLLQYRAAA